MRGLMVVANEVHPLAPMLNHSLDYKAVFPDASEYDISRLPGGSETYNPLTCLESRLH